MEKKPVIFSLFLYMLRYLFFSLFLLLRFSLCHSSEQSDYSVSFRHDSHARDSLSFLDPWVYIFSTELEKALVITSSNTLSVLSPFGDSSHTHVRALKLSHISATFYSLLNFLFSVSLWITSIADFKFTNFFPSVTSNMLKFQAYL